MSGMDFERALAVAEAEALTTRLENLPDKYCNVETRRQKSRLYAERSRLQRLLTIELMKIKIVDLQRTNQLQQTLLTTQAEHIRILEHDLASERSANLETLDEIVPFQCD